MNSLKKNTLLCFIIVGFSFFSCTSEDKVDINGTWFITEMSFQDAPLYPKSTNRVAMGILKGNIDYEYLSFRIVDSTVVLPGFNSDKLITEFAFRDKQLIIKPNSENPELELTNLIFEGIYTLKYSSSENTMELTSEETTITLIHQDEVRSQNLDNVFKAIK